jgi:GPH family glycoside/pentoside/hexuronide:cation symporter
MRQATVSDAAWGLGRPGAWRATGAYGAAHIAKSLFWYGGEVVFAYFLTEFAGLAPSRMGFVLAAGLVFSTGMDLLVGFGAQRQMANAARAGRLQAIGAIAAAIGLIAFLATPQAPEAGRWIWALLTVSLFRAGFALYDVPQNALMSVATAGPAARNRVAAVRIAGSGVASLAVAGFVGPLIAAGRTGGGPALVMAVGLVAAVAAIATAWILALALRGSPPPRPPAQPGAAWGGQVTSLAPYLAMMAVMMAAPPLFQKLEPYFAADVLRSAAWGGAIILAAAAGITAGQPFWLSMPAQRRARVFLFGALIQAAGAAVFLIASPENPALLTCGAFLVGLGNGGLGVAKWAAFSDAAARYCPGREGVAFAIFAGVGKLFLALGIAVLAAVIQAAREEPRLIAWAMAAGPMVGSLAMCGLSWLAARAEASIGDPHPAQADALA